jgi:hypothetical protein
MAQVRLSVLSAAITKGGSGDEIISGVVLENIQTGQREWIWGATWQVARAILNRRTGNWLGREFGIVAGEAIIYA